MKIIVYGMARCKMFHAYLEGNASVFGEGKSKNGAIGDMIARNPEVFQVEFQDQTNYRHTDYSNTFNVNCSKRLY